MRRLIVGVMVAAALVSAGRPGKCAWSVFGADAGHTGYTAEVPTLPMSTLWKFYYPEAQNQTTAAVDEGRVYFAGGPWLFCLSAESGARLWEFNTQVGIRSSPAVVGDLVIFGDDAGVLRALDKTTGAPRWEKTFEGAIMAPPLVYLGKVFIGTASMRVVALEPATGETVWTYKTEGPVSLPLAGGGKMVFALDRSGFIYALEATTGRQMWKGESEAPLAAGPVVTEDVICLVSGPYLYGMTLRGSKLWQVRSDRPLAYAPAVAGDMLYMTGSDGRLYAMGSRNGAIKWVYDDPEISITASPSVAGKIVFAGGSNGSAAALDAASGKLLWKCQGRSLNSPLDTPGSQSAASQPVFADGSLLVLSNDGNLACFSPKGLDLSGPVIAEIGPSGRQVVSGMLPLAIQARIFDEGSGLNPDSIAVYHCGEKGRMEKDPESGAYFLIVTGEKPGEVLPDGTHTVSLSASDYRGNSTAVEWRFATDKNIPVAERLVPEELAAQQRMARQGARPLGQRGASLPTLRRGSGLPRQSGSRLPSAQPTRRGQGFGGRSSLPAARPTIRRSSGST